MYLLINYFSFFWLLPLLLRSWHRYDGNSICSQEMMSVFFERLEIARFKKVLHPLYCQQKLAAEKAKTEREG